MVVVLRAVDLGDRDLGVLIVALPALRRLLHFANLALGGRVHYTVHVRHRVLLVVACFARSQRYLARENTLGRIVPRKEETRREEETRGNRGRAVQELRRDSGNLARDSTNGLMFEERKRRRGPTVASVEMRNRSVWSERVFRVYPAAFELAN